MANTHTTHTRKKKGALGDSSKGRINNELTAIVVMKNGIYRPFRLLNAKPVIRAKAMMIKKRNAVDRF